MFLKLAWLNIWRNKRRTLIMILSICFAVFFTTINQTNKIGFYNNMIKGNVGSYSGYIQIHKKGFWEDRSLDNCFQLSDTCIRRLSKNHKIADFVPRIETFALASSNEKTKGLMIIGIDPEPENKLTKLSGRIIQGKYLHKEDKQIIIGEGVASYFHMKVGDTMDIIGQGYRGVNAVNRYTIKGIVKYPVVNLNNSIIYLPIKACENLFGTENRITTYCLNVNPNDVENIASTLSTQLNPLLYEVMDWKSMQPELVQTIKLIKFMNLFIYLILYIVVGFGIFGSYYMMLKERDYEFGIMIASGMKRGILQRIAMAEIIILALFGLILGLLLGFIIIFYLHNNPIPLTGETAQAYIRLGLEPIIDMPLTANPFLIQSLIIFLLSVGIGTYSIRKINKLDITTAIR